MKLTNIDLTNNTQKIIAGAFVILGITILWVLLPPMIWFMKNLIYAAALFVAISFLVMCRGIIWQEMKRLSFVLTQKLIYKNAPYYMRNYYEYLDAKNRELNEAIKSVDQSKLLVKNDIDSLQANINIKMRLAKQGDEAAALEAKIDADTLNTLMPQYASLEDRIGKMNQVYNLRLDEAKKTRVTIEGQIKKYEVFQRISTAVNSANKASAINSEEFKQYEIANKALEEQVAGYIANINDFDRKVKPELERAALQKAADKEEAKDYLAEYMKTRELPKLVAQQS